MTEPTTQRMPAPGERVRFTGGAGRDDADTVQAGIVNGEWVFTGDAYYVPVHIPKTNQNVFVRADNLVD